MENFGTRLAECRRNKNFTQDELANRLGVTPQALSKWEKGMSSPDISMVCSICEVLDISADYLLGTGPGKLAENEDINGWEKSWNSLRGCLDQLKIIFGMEIVPAFVDALEGNRYIEKISLLRQKLAKEGTVLPVVRLMDQSCIKAKEFYILAYENVLYREEVDQLKIIFGMEIVPAFVDALEGNRYIEKISLLRQKLAKEGTVLPVVRLMDQSCIKAKEFYILAYENVLYREEVEQVDENTFDYILGKLEETVRTKYAEILDADIIKGLADNLRLQYPALITGIVPEKISYGRLLDVCKFFINRGNSLMYLPKIIEAAERTLREQPGCTTKELSEAVCSQIERPDNFWVMLNN